MRWPPCRFTRQEDVALLKSSSHRRKISKEALLDLIADMYGPWLLQLKAPGCTPS